MPGLLSRSAAWRALAAATEEGGPSVAELFDQDPQRFERYSLALDDLLVDVSRHPLTAPVWRQLLALADERDLAGRIEALFTGEPVNASEGRPALHTALRQPPGEALTVGGEDVLAAVHRELERLEALVEALRAGRWRGYDGRPIRHIVHIGIGGSECGVTLGCEALAAERTGGPAVHVVSGVDGRELAEAWRRIDPAAALFVVASKSFTTQETLTNARTAWAWLAEAAGREVPEQFVGVSADEPAMARFGIPEGQRLRIGEWVGGRYSLPSAMGLPVAAAIGTAAFRELLRGMHDMDRHFRTAPWAENLPAVLGLLGVWQISARGAGSHVVLPYHPGLRRLPAYLQQLDMESLGKSVTQDGTPVDTPTGAACWGEVGGNAQHSFFQWLHQGTARAVAEMIVPLDEAACPEAHRGLTLANALGQAQALAHGHTPAAGEPAAAHRAYPGSRPVTLILFRRLDPYSLGRLIALHEHRVFVQASLWGINPFDQWGVELGKRAAKALIPAARGEAPPPAEADAATRGALAWARRWQG